MGLRRKTKIYKLSFMSSFMDKKLENLVKEKGYYKNNGDMGAFLSIVFCALGTVCLKGALEDNHMISYFVAFGSYAASGFEFYRASKHWKKFHEISDMIRDYRR